MIIFYSIVIFFSFKKLFRSFKNTKDLKYDAKFTFDKNNLKNWMSLTKKERYNQLKKESISNLNKRKILLEEIRKEYKKISKKNPKINNKTT